MLARSGTVRLVGVSCLWRCLPTTSAQPRLMFIFLRRSSLVSILQRRIPGPTEILRGPCRAVCWFCYNLHSTLGSPLGGTCVGWIHGRSHVLLGQLQLPDCVSWVRQPLHSGGRIPRLVLHEYSTALLLIEYGVKRKNQYWKRCFQSANRHDPSRFARMGSSTVGASKLGTARKFFS